MKYDIIIIGSGPAGYVSAIRAAQLGFKVAIAEKENLGGICLNWGCIPTKALLKSAQVFKYINEAEKYGLNKSEAGFDFSNIINRSRGVAEKMSKGIEFLMRKNKIDVILGVANLKKNKQVEITNKDGETNLYQANHIILATGARSRVLPNIPQDGQKIIGYRNALALPKLPKSMIIVGSGAIGLEFAQVYSSLGTKVVVVEFMPNIMPLEDVEVSKQLEKSLKKLGIEIMTNSSVELASKTVDGVKANVKTQKGEVVLEAEILLSAVGIEANIENIGLEEVGIITEKGKVLVNEWYETNREGYYAIGDIIPTQALAHVASAEGITCVEKIKGLDVEAIDYGNIPACTYTSPEVASVGLTEKQAREQGLDIKVGKFPFSANGKSTANGEGDGFVKVIFDAKYGEWLGCHMLGNGVTEMIAEAVVARKLETTGHQIIKAIHPHPTLCEAIMEAAAAAYGEVIHI